MCLHAGGCMHHTCEEVVYNYMKEKHAILGTKTNFGLDFVKTFGESCNFI